MLLIMAKNTRMAMGEAGLVPVEILGVKGAREGTTMDDDFEPVESEVGMFLKFHCHGDTGARRFLYSRSIIDSRTFAPAEHAWSIRCSEGEGERAVDFRGRLYNYAERTIAEGKAIEMSGRIRVAD